MEQSFTSVGVFALLGLGLIFGLKHATEVDHVVAVSAIVSENKSVFRSFAVGALWGAGHTVSLLVVGLIVLLFRVAIPEQVASWLEFGVALMIILLGVTAIVGLIRKRPDVHWHRHTHDGHSHVHLHFHEHSTQHSHNAESAKHSHAVSKLGFKPLLVGMMHGLAGSAALTLLVLTQITSVWLGLLYLTLFGIGATAGMLLLSGLIGLPFALSGNRLTRFNYILQTAAGVLSIAFGLWYAYETAFTRGL
jgi:cytochrome c biogenesis protein CcdA